MGRVLQTSVRLGETATPEKFFTPRDPAATMVSPVIVTKTNQSFTQQVNRIDWITIGLGLLTVAAVGGLIPLWIAVLFNLL